MIGSGRQADPPRSPCTLRSVGLVVGALILLALVLCTPRQAGAHEIGVALAVPATSVLSETDAADVVDGLRLAIDQSPDVGHAPGPDAGDHLGGVDVRLVVLDDTSGEGAGGSVRAAVADGASVVVVVGDAAAATEAASALPRESGFLIAVVRGAGEVDPGVPVAVLRETGTDGAGAEADAFPRDFMAAHGRDPSAPAAIGYDIGKLLDVLIGETGDAVPDLASLDRVAAAAQARLRITSLEGVVQSASSIARGPVDGGGEEEGDDAGIRLVVVGVLVALAAVAALRIRRRRTASRTG